MNLQNECQHLRERRQSANVAPKTKTHQVETHEVRKQNTKSNINVQRTLSKEKCSSFRPFHLFFFQNLKCLIISSCNQFSTLFYFSYHSDLLFSSPIMHHVTFLLLTFSVTNASLRKKTNTAMVVLILCHSSHTTFLAAPCRGKMQSLVVGFEPFLKKPTK